MLTQLFGNYLLRQHLVSPSHLIEALRNATATRVKLGVLAINAGLMTAEQVENVHEIQKTMDKRIGDIMVEQGYMTGEQVVTLLKSQKSGHLVLGQALIDNGHMTTAQFANALKNFKLENNITDDDFSDIRDEVTDKMLSRFYKLNDQISNQHHLVEYVSLLFKNLIRFVGDDFIPSKIERITGDAQGAQQRIKSGLSAITMIDSDEATIMEFAARFANEELTVNDDYTKACVSEFLNLHNGLFAVKLSVTEGIELELEPQQYYDHLSLSQKGTLFVFPVDYTFGTINFIVCI
ncbi:MAG: chemotaxis protein CheX [Ruminococcus sp.]|nr:chemotaxis protein CheX [Ruminococcus sp.]